MRYYGIVTSLADGRPYIESETTEPGVIEDSAGAVPRDQVEADPALREALEAWERKDDSGHAISRASWILEHYGPGIVMGSEDVTDIILELIVGVDDPWCDAVRRAAPHLSKAAAILRPAVDEVRTQLDERGKRARAERDAEQVEGSV